MKNIVSINGQAIKEVIKNFEAIVKTKFCKNIEDFQYIKVIVNEDHVLFTLSTPELSYSKLIMGQSQNVFNFRLHVSELKNLATFKEVVTITQDEESLKGAVSGMVLNFENYIVKDEYTLKTDKESIALIDLSEEAKQAIKKATNYISNDAFRPAMCGVYVEYSHEGNLQITATDAHRLYTSGKIDCCGSSHSTSFIIPETALKIINNMPKQDITIYAYEDLITFSGEKEIISFKPIDARFPDYKAVIPRYDSCIELDNKKLIKDLKNFKQGNNKFKQVQLHFLENKLNCEILTKDHWDEKKLNTIGLLTNIPVNNKVGDFKIAFNYNLLNEVLATMDNKVQLLSEGHNNRAMIFMSPNSKEIALLMPLMLAV